VTQIGVVEFPGTNCMRETQAVLEAAGARASLVRWNDDPARWRDLDGFVLAGGFAYEDRVRAGVIASKMPLLDGIAAAVDAGKPVLGVCTGAQVLVESGLVPGITPGSVEIALAHNASPAWPGYYCDWVHLRCTSARGWLAGCADQRPTLPMPVGHGEGCFTGSPEFFADLERRGQIALRYVRPDATPARGFPHNPNASLQDAAGVCDPSGRVLAMMPHPERAGWLFQVPASLAGPWGARRRSASAQALLEAGPGFVLYESFVQAATRTAQGA
jgi:phosphoribosylformylglycinamidine synthase